MTRRVMVVLLALAAACQGKEAKPPETKPVEPAAETKPVVEPTAAAAADAAPATPSPPPAEPKPGEPVLVFAPAKIIATRGGQQNELSLDAAGKVFLDGHEVGALTAAGELSMGGKVVATLAADGKMTLVSAPNTHLSITPAGALLDTNGKVGLAPQPDGTLSGAISEAMPGLAMKVEGDKAAYRALMFAWMGVSKSSRN